MAKSKEYVVTASINGKKYTGKGSTVLKALESLSVRNAKGKVIMTVQSGKEKKDRVLMGHQVARLFGGHGLMKEVALKQVSSLFDGI